VIGHTDFDGLVVPLSAGCPMPTAGKRHYDSSSLLW
jgi:hypothetical protein